MTHTRETARQYIVTAIEGPGEAKADEFDVEAIIDYVYHLTDDYDPARLHHRVFWEAVAHFPAKNGKAAS